MDVRSKTRDHLGSHGVNSRGHDLFFSLRRRHNEPACGNARSLQPQDTAAGRLAVGIGQSADSPAWVINLSLAHFANKVQENKAAFQTSLVSTRELLAAIRPLLVMPKAIQDLEAISPALEKYVAAYDQ